MSVNIIKSNIVTVVTVLNFPRKIVCVGCVGGGVVPGTWRSQVIQGSGSCFLADPLLFPAVTLKTWGCGAVRHFLVSRAPPPPLSCEVMFVLTLEGGQRTQKMLRPAPRTGLDCSGGGGVASVISDSLRWFLERAHPPQDHVLL